MYCLTVLKFKVLAALLRLKVQKTIYLQLLYNFW